MALRAFNATRCTRGGPFQSVTSALAWATNNLTRMAADSDEVASELEAFGRCMVSDGQDAMFAEDVVIFDDQRFEPDEDGQIEW